MKKIIAVLLFFFPIFLSANGIDFKGQEAKINSILFNLINEYRTSHNVQALTYSNLSDSVTKTRNESMIKCECLTHEQNKINGVVLINSVENVAIDYFYDLVVENSVKHTQYGQLKIYDETRMYSIANLILNSWKTSELHNKNLLNKNLKFSAVSVKIDTQKEMLVSTFNAFQSQ